MKRNTNKFLQVGIVLVAFFGFVFAVHAQTWTAPVGSPPSNNVWGPINMGSSTQFKTGAFGVGESSSTTLGTASGFSLEINGPLSANGFASFGTTLLQQDTYVGPPNTCTSCYSAAQVSTVRALPISVPASGGVPTYTVPYNASAYTEMSGTSMSGTSDVYTGHSNLASNIPATSSNDSDSSLGGVFDKVGGFLADLLNPSSADAAVNVTDNGPSIPIPFGPCYGYWCNSEQYCDNVTEACASMGTTLTSGQTDINTGVANTNFTSATTGGSGSNGGTDPGILYGLPTSIGFTSKRADLVAELSLSSIPSSGTFTPTLVATTTSGTMTLYWHIGSASGCTITSANPTQNVNITPALNPAGFSNGYYGISFSGASPGSYTYTLACNSAAEFFSPHGASTSVTVVVGDNYVFDVNGNSAIEGYIVANGNINTNGQFIEHGKRVCLEDGTDCPKNSATNVINPIDQGGSLELGANNLVNSNSQTPYIDFHYGSSSNQTADYNMRIINGSNQRLDFQYAGGTEIFWIDNNGIHLQSGKHIYDGAGTSTVVVN